MTDPLRDRVPAGARTVGFPLRGEWTAVQTPAARIPSHGTEQLAQRYAFDFVRLDPRPGRRGLPDGLRGLVLGIPTRAYPGWGEPVYAALDGEVVEAVDGTSERSRVHAAREAFLAVRTGLRFRPTPEWAQRVVGNHVILRHDDVCSVYAHLATGSVAVAPGALVREGDVLGRVGHTGNSTAPHLHFQLMDGPDALVARAVACRFRVYEVADVDGTGWRLVRDGIPRPDERIRCLA